ncbi:MAG: hypothetical protein KJ044_08250 [Planctomycetes bacterium]|nr:hypothetical protein [Planctomycetota bacterium]
MAFLKKHARFLVVMILLYFANAELADSRRKIESSRGAAKSLLTQNYGALFKDAKAFGGEPAVVEGRKIQDRTQALGQVESGRNSMLAFETDPAFTLASLGQGAGDDDKVTYYRTKAAEVTREFTRRRYIQAEGDSAVGFKADDKNITAAMVPALLRRLDIARTVSNSAGRSGVTWLRKLAFKSAGESIAARKLPVRDAALDATKVAREGDIAYFDADCLELEVQANEEALYNFLVDLQRPMKDGARTRYLAVERFKLEKPDLLDPADNLVTATILVVAYKVNEDSPYPVDRSGPQQQQSTVGQPRSFRDR